MSAGLGVADLDFALYHIIVLVGSLFLQANAVDFLAEHSGAAIEDGDFGTIDTNQTVVYACGIEGCQSVLHCGDFHVATGKHGATGRVGNVFGQGVDYRLPFEVGSLNFVAVVFTCGKKCGFDFQAGVQAFSFYGKLTVESKLFHYMIDFICTQNCAVVRAFLRAGR